MGGKKGKRLYCVKDLEEYLGFDRTQENSDGERKTSDGYKTETILYCRVSSVAQKEDLQKQIQELKDAYPHHTSVISDVASGLNFKRKGLQRLLDATLRGMVQEVVVLHKDRLCRYGIELMESLFDKTGTRFVVHSQSSNGENSTQELAEDLLAITNVFVARNNGRRSAENRRQRAASNNHFGNTRPSDPRRDESSETASVSESTTAQEAQRMVRRGPVDVQPVR